MKRFNRLLLAWLLLLALPLQGFAGARMPLCGSALPAQAGHAHESTMNAMPAMFTVAAHGAAGHDHAAMLRAQAAAHDDAGGGHHVAKAHAEHGTKAGSCASCCIGAALAPLLPAALPAQHPGFLPVPFRAGHLPSVDPVLPERPPRHARA